MPRVTSRALSAFLRDELRCVPFTRLYANLMQKGSMKMADQMKALKNGFHGIGPGE